MEIERLLTLKECAAVLGCRPKTLYQKIAAGEIPKVVLWRGPRKESVRFSASALSAPAIAPASSRVSASSVRNRGRQGFRAPVARFSRPPSSRVIPSEAFPMN